MIRTSQNSITEPQLRFIHGLIDERDLLKSPKIFDACNAMDQEEWDAYKASLKERASTLTKREASQWIERLKGLPTLHQVRKGTDSPHNRTTWCRVGYMDGPPNKDGEPTRIPYLVHPDFPDTKIARGSYALDTSADEGYRNDVTFFTLWIGDRGGWKLYLKHSDDGTELPKPVAAVIIGRIAVNPLEAASRYGLEMERCGICGRGLTADESRARGIGPICAERYGW